MIHDEIYFGMVCRSEPCIFERKGRYYSLPIKNSETFLEYVSTMINFYVTLSDATPTQVTYVLHGSHHHACSSFVYKYVTNPEG